MPLASGVNKQIAFKKETICGALPGPTGAQLVRRVDSVFNLSKDTYESNEIRTDYQVADMRHGINRVAGTLNGELSPGSYAPFLGSLLKRDFTTLAASTGLGITIATAGSAWTITRAAGSWLTAGQKVGQVGRLSLGVFSAANLNKNLLILAVTALALTVIPLNGQALVAEGPIASATWSTPGKQTFIPISGHTDDSYTFEEWFSDVPRSEVFGGNKVTQASIQLPPSGLSTISLTFAGQRMSQPPSGTRYYTSPTAAGTSGLFAAVNGALMVGGVMQLAITGLNFEINGNFSGDGVVGSNFVPQQYPGRVKVSGQFTAYFDDGILPGYFYDESEIAIAAALTTGSAAASDFLAFSMSRVKVGGAEKSDSEGGVVRTYPFTALLNPAGGAGQPHEQTTITLQDSLA